MPEWVGNNPSLFRGVRLTFLDLFAELIEQGTFEKEVWLNDDEREVGVFGFLEGLVHAWFTASEEAGLIPVDTALMSASSAELEHLFFGGGEAGAAADHDECDARGVWTGDRGEGLEKASVGEFDELRVEFEGWSLPDELERRVLEGRGDCVGDIGLGVPGGEEEDGEGEKALDTLLLEGLDTGGDIWLGEF